MRMQHNSNHIIIEQNKQIIELLSKLAASGGTIPQVPAMLQQKSDDINLFTVARKKNWNQAEREYAYNLFPDLPHIKFLKSIGK